MNQGLFDLIRDGVQALDPYEVPQPAGIRVFLDANESPFSLEPALADELAAELSRVQLNRYPDGHARALREALARDAGCRVEQVCVGNGSDELIALIATLFSCPRGDGPSRMAFPVPTFGMYRTAALMQGALPVEIPVRADFSLDRAALDDALRDRPNVLFLARPNNPTGALWPRAALIEAALRDQEMVVVSDEAYFDYSGETVLDELAALPNLIVVRTLSKLGLAALRIGYLIADEALVYELEKIRPPYNIGTLNQVAATWLLAHHRDAFRAQIERVKEERAWLAAKLQADPRVRVFPTAANFVLFRVGQAGDGRATELWSHLISCGVLVRCFDRPGPLAGCLRVTIGTHEENLVFLDSVARY